MAIKLIAKVKKWNHNREVLSVQMVEAEPHIMKFIGNDSEEMYGAAGNEMMAYLMEKGHAFSVETLFVDASIVEMVA